MKRDVDLLAHFELEGSGTTSRRGFVNLLQLSESRLLMECDDAFALGDTLALNFYVPGAESPSAERTRVSLTCSIRRCEDPEKLRYEASVREVDAESGSAIRRFVASLPPPRRPAA